MIDIIKETLNYEQEEKRIQEGYLNQPLKEITEEEWDYYLGVLPPLKWTMDSFDSSCQYFFCPEFTIGLITQQFYKSHDKYYTKYANPYDKSTWISQTAIFEYKQRNK